MLTRPSQRHLLARRGKPPPQRTPRAGSRRLLPAHRRRRPLHGQEAAHGLWHQAPRLPRGRARRGLLQPPLPGHHPRALQARQDCPPQHRRRRRRPHRQLLQHYPHHRRRHLHLARHPRLSLQGHRPLLQARAPRPRRPARGL